MRNTGPLGRMAWLFIILFVVLHLRAMAADQPNVLFILADDLGWRDTAIYGSTYYSTPNIDELARSGVRFTCAYSAHPLCSPTRASIMTGQYPVRHGLTQASGHIPQRHEHRELTAGPAFIRGCGPSGLNYLDPKHNTLGEAMKSAGYATGFFGKWHMGTRPEYWPENHGFDVVRGGRQHPGPPGRNGKAKFFPPWSCNTLDANVPADTHVDDLIADNTIEFMKEQQKKGKPFFACYWAYSVHAPYQSKPALVEKWKQKGIDLRNPQHAPTMGAMIEVLDDNVGRLMQALQENGLDENTIVIFTSDNGGNMYDSVDGTTPTNNFPLRNGKGNNYEGGVRVPLIVRWPGVTEPGSVSDAVVSSVDHYPALLEMTSQPLRPQQHKDGVSYVPALRGQPFDRGPTLCDMPHWVPATGNIPNTWLRMDEWKMIRFWFDSRDGGHRHELYNLKDDIAEANDLVATHPEQLARMVKVLDAYYEKSRVLGYHPNVKYDRRSAGTWFPTSDAGEMLAVDGALVMRAAKPGYTVKNRFFPHGGKGMVLAFEARSPTGTALQFAGPRKPVTVHPGAVWSAHRIPGTKATLSGKGFAVSLAEAGTVELRNVRVLTPDGTVVMMRYRFD